jgi:hypothetical protein
MNMVAECIFLRTPSPGAPGLGVRAFHGILQSLALD